MPTRYQELPAISERECVVLPLAAGPAAAAAATEQASFVAHRASTVVEAHIFPSADVAQDAADPSVLTLQVGATVVGTVNNAAVGGITAAAGLALTLTAANVNLSDGDVLKVVATNAGAGAQDLSTTAFYCNVTLRPNL